MAIRFATLVFSLILCSPTSALSDKEYNRFIDSQLAFANAHNDWAMAITSLSPASPDYAVRVREEWLKREIGQKFRRLEQSLP